MSHLLTTPSENKRGIGAAWVMMIMVMVITVGMAFLLRTQIFASIAGTDNDHSRALYLARSAHQHALWRITHDDIPGNPDVYTMHDLAENRYGYRIVSDTVRLDTEFADRASALSPLAYWRLGDTSTALTDNIGSFDGTYENGVLREQTGALDGVSDTAANFDGVNDYCLVPSNAALPSTGDFSVACWIKPDTFPPAVPALSYHTIFAFGVADGTSNTLLAQLGTGNGGTIIYEHDTQPDGAAKETESFASALSVGVWSHVALTRDVSAKALILYIDGQNTASINYTDAPVSTIANTQVRIGGWDSFFDGLIDEVVLDDTVWSDQDVETLYGQVGAYGIATVGKSNDTVVRESWVLRETSP